MAPFTNPSSGEIPTGSAPVAPPASNGVWLIAHECADGTYCLTLHTTGGTDAKLLDRLRVYLLAGEVAVRVTSLLDCAEYVEGLNRQDGKNP